MNTAVTHLKKRTRHSGSTLVIFAAFSVTLVALMGIVIFTSLQTLLHHELQQTASAASKAGAAYYYSGLSANNRPLRDPATSIRIATNTFNNLVANSSVLRGFNATLINVTANAANDSITVESKVSFGTPLLAPIGIRQVDMKTKETARAVKMIVTDSTGKITINPGKSALVDLEFPLADTPGLEVLVSQDGGNADVQGYIVEACNSNKCYDLDSGAQSIDGGNSAFEPNGSVNRAGRRIFFGDASFFFAAAGVTKATKLRISNANMKTINIKPAIIDSIFIYGYSSACVSETVCPIPAGFAPAS